MKQVHFYISVQNKNKYLKSKDEVSMFFTLCTSMPISDEFFEIIVKFFKQSPYSKISSHHNLYNFFITFFITL